MASNDPIASKARKPALSIEDAERFASQIRPSWELLGPDGASADFGLDDGAAPAAPSAGAGGRPADTIIEGVPAIVVGGSDESVPIDASWDVDEPVAAKAVEAPAPPIEAQVIASIGIPSKAEVPVAELQLPPQVGHPMVPTPGAPVAPSPPAKTKLGVGGTSAEREPMAKPKPTRAPASTPASARAVAAVPMAKPAASKSRPGATNPGAAYVPAADEADDDIALPISGAPKGLLLKIGGGVALVAVILIAVKLFTGSSKPEPAKTTPTAVVTTAAVAAPPPLDPALAEPPKATATVAPVVTATAAPTVAATTAPTAKEKPVVAKVEPPPPPAVTAKKTPAVPPAGTTPAGPAKKKGGGIIRETPF
jgi:hypothetical protein